ncbi:Glycosyl hydrolase family 38 protein [Forsythia ovata]|uniref:Glycosyl hydrolase family 38 protein n=1 Tax=Forsythia ovata TaxID=205694 RepID=A0ABD1NYE6_9LAMI
MKVAAYAEQSYSYYSGYNGTDRVFQASGAYVFRPNGTFPIKPEGQVPLTVLRGPILDEVHHQLNTWLHQVTRVYKEKEHAEVEFTIGPIPVDDGFGKEITAQIKTSLNTNETFYTDSNGRDFIKRIRDHRSDWDLEIHQPIAGNYYLYINLGIYLEDGNMEVSVLVDRAVGGSSLVDGQIELMLHRLAIQGKFFLRIDPRGEGAKWRRTFGQEVYSPLLLAFSEEELESGKALLRLAHLYEVGEDKDYSVLTSVELKKLFPDKKIIKVTEMNLSANQERREVEKKRLDWKVEGTTEEVSVVKGGVVDPVKLVVELAPMEIRTFVIEFDHLKTFAS